ncbi:EhaD family protein [Methanobrevibacter filiformis]|nr:EhaD family protein [Methanobrevibacter filiformis]
MNPLDFINLTTISVVLMFIGAIGVIGLVKPLDKILMFSLMEAGFFAAVVSFRYLDVAFIIALIGPISIIVLLLSVIKITEIRQKNLEDS